MKIQVKLIKDRDLDLSFTILKTLTLDFLQKEIIRLNLEFDAI